MMQTLLFCFANQILAPLTTLQDEYEKIDELLDGRNHLNHFLKVPVPFATTESMVRKINEYRDSLTVFHFSGHANHTTLHLEDTNASAKGIAQLLGRCPNLKLIFLNGCSTKKHIAQLIAQNIQAAVIVTYALVNDDVATKFSIAFYKALNHQYSLKEAIEEARLSIIKADAEGIRLQEVDRGFGSEKEVDKDQWYFHCPNQETAQWRLSTSIETSTYEPNTIIREKLFETLCQKDEDLSNAYINSQALYNDQDLIVWVHKQLLERLPYPLSEPLRRLFSQELSPLENRWHPIALSKERLKNYNIFVDNCLNLIICLYLAQIRDYLLQLQNADPKTNTFPSIETLAPVRRILIDGWLHYTPEEWVNTLHYLQELLHQWNVTLFVEGIEEVVENDLAKENLKFSRLYESLVFFYELRQQVTSPTGIPNVAYYCEIGEKYLEPLLKRVDSWASYRLESVRHIRVITYFDLFHGSYSHEKVVLRTSLADDHIEKVLMEKEQDTAWNCQSVLLVDQQNKYVNLSPFFIDRNVYKKSSTIFDLYIFTHHRQEKLVFTRMAYPTHPSLEVSLKGPSLNAQENFRILVRQAKKIYEMIH